MYTLKTVDIDWKMAFFDKFGNDLSVREKSAVTAPRKNIFFTYSEHPIRFSPR